MSERPITEADPDAVAAIVVADSEALTSRPSRLGPNDVRDWWSRADLTRDSWLFLEDGDPIAAGWLHPFGDKAAFAGIVAQGAKGRGLAGAIADRAETAAQARGLVRMHTWALAAAIRNDAERNDGGYVGIIGVRRAWRGRGLAKALLLRTFGEFWRRGTKRVSLDVDADSPTGATRLYESVGMYVEGAMAVYER